MCSGCATSKATKRPWKVKGKHQATIKEVTFCGEYISADQLDATTPGFIAQLKGWLTHKRYCYVAVFIDHKSNLDYIDPQISLTSKETLKAKHAFELYAKSHGVSVLNYHANNGRFQDQLWRKDCEQKTYNM